MSLKRSILALVALMVLGACSSYRTTYSGREESTQGVPGFVDGKKISPNVKLGQSYTIDGETYVPRHQPDYTEEGMASWYGPGFHGGKTANGEIFDSRAMTAAHRTLPLPSIVRVTMISTGKQVYVRVNDRGPFAHSRIIDLSRAAAEEIGLVRKGVGKVRVEYMAEESERFANLLGKGRKPNEIDLAEVFKAPEPKPIVLAQNKIPESEESIFSHLNPIRSAQAEETQLATPTANDNSPFSALNDSSEAKPNAVMQTASLEKPVPVAASTSENLFTYYVQLGAFKNLSNAEQLQKKYDHVANVRVTQKRNLSDVLLYYVRVGPQETAEEARVVFEKLEKAGAEVRLIKE